MSEWREAIPCLTKESKASSSPINRAGLRNEAIELPLKLPVCTKQEKSNNFRARCSTRTRLSGVKTVEGWSVSLPI